ncbi:hypothetical protein SAMN04490201_1923 [Pseudomonas psychrophila]|jgi:hypothetical protein|uniref:Uncharacterized protein n=1 Tax=Pseudomonas psychrophila TaxID=122355 RepID=A0ABY0VQ16_9PSED|nr:hypothetical protein TU76_02260 [Pseudomonas psychrophila]SDU48057.1 hypothetical protein SAMN04490201_1923 [Pseudomonas psychrophila]
MIIPPQCPAAPLDNAPSPLFTTEHRARLSGQIKSITNILVLMLCHMAANATDGGQLAAPSHADGVLQRAVPLKGMYLAPQLRLASTSTQR